MGNDTGRMCGSERDEPLRGKLANIMDHPDVFRKNNNNNNKASSSGRRRGRPGSSSGGSGKRRRLVRGSLHTALAFSLVRGREDAVGRALVRDLSAVTGVAESQISIVSVRQTIGPADNWQHQQQQQQNHRSRHEQRGGRTPRGAASSSAGHTIIDFASRSARIAAFCRSLKTGKRRMPSFDMICKELSLAGLIVKGLDVKVSKGGKDDDAALMTALAEQQGPGPGADPGAGPAGQAGRRRRRRRPSGTHCATPRRGERGRGGGGGVLLFVASADTDEGSKRASGGSEDDLDAALGEADRKALLLLGEDARRGEDWHEEDEEDEEDDAEGDDGDYNDRGEVADRVHDDADKKEEGRTDEEAGLNTSVGDEQALLLLSPEDYIWDRRIVRGFERRRRVRAARQARHQQRDVIAVRFTGTRDPILILSDDSDDDSDDDDDDDDDEPSSVRVSQRAGGAASGNHVLTAAMMAGGCGARDSIELEDDGVGEQLLVAAGGEAEGEDGEHDDGDSMMVDTADFVNIMRRRIDDFSTTLTAVSLIQKWWRHAAATKDDSKTFSPGMGGDDDRKRLVAAHDDEAAHLPRRQGVAA